MPIIRKVFGPFAPEVTNGNKWNRAAGQYDEIVVDARWYFFGIRGDKTTAHWVLIYNVETRKFLASNVPINDGLTGRSRKALYDQKISPIVKDETAHPDAFLDDSPVMEGRIADILKSKLSAADIAKATALAITRR